MTIQAHLEPRRMSHARRDVRMKLRLPTSGKLPASRATDVTIQDLSTGGMLIQAEAEFAIGERIEVDLPRTGIHLAEVVWSSGTFFGCRFVKPIPPAAVSAALLRSLPAEAAMPETPAEGASSQGRFADRLSALRIAKGWSQEELAERLAVSRQAVWYWETGQRLPRAEHFRALAKEFGVPERDLITHPEMSTTHKVPAVVEECKQRIAGELGIPESSVRIVIEF